MGCSSSKENDKTAAFARNSRGQTYGEQAEDAAAMLSGAGALYTRLQLSISCKDLINLDHMSKSDPFVLVKLFSPTEHTHPVEIGRTEIISNSLDPRFVTIIPITFKFEEVQNLIFEVYDVDTAYNSSDATHIDPSKQDFQGKTECALAQIVGGHNQTWEGALTEGRSARGVGSRGSSPKVIVRAEEVANSNALVELVLAGSGVRGGKSNFLRISRLGESGPPTPCYKTETLSTTKSTGSAWGPINLSLQLLANGDVYRPLIIEVFSWKRSGAHILVGSCKASVNDMQSMVEGGRHDLTLGGGAGSLSVRSCTLVPQPSFFDYIAGGMQIGFTIAIDYTASNGDPSQPGTLHYHDPSSRTLNEYGQAIHSVGGVLEYFDDDRRFPVYGFGGCPVFRQPASHCFSVNGDDAHPEVEGIGGILGVYRESLLRIQLSGPTLFAPVINQAAAMAASTMTQDPLNQQYTILMIITDGIITDMDNTVNAIVAASEYPFSIIIVGVGQADYTAMEALDGDDVRLRNSSGQAASRDIVQFVPMRDFVGKSSYALAKEVLEEIPAQVLEYMKKRGIPPGDPRRRMALAQQRGSVGSMALQESFMDRRGPTQRPSFAHHGASARGGPYQGPSQGTYMQQPGPPSAPLPDDYPPYGQAGDHPPPYTQ
ncbi:unnamed protein product [Ascophyllum nodosum]